MVDDADFEDVLACCNRSHGLGAARHPAGPEQDRAAPLIPWRD